MQYHTILAKHIQCLILLNKSSKGNCIYNVVVVVPLATGSCIMTELWGGDVPTLVRDFYYPRLHCYCYVLSIPVPLFQSFLYPPPSSSMSWLPITFTIIRLSRTALHTQFSPSFRSCTVWKNNCPFPPASTTRLAFAILPSSTCSIGPCWNL